MVQRSMHTSAGCSSSYDDTAACAAIAVSSFALADTSLALALVMVLSPALVDQCECVWYKALVKFCLYADVGQTHCHLNRHNGVLHARSISEAVIW